MVDYKWRKWARGILVIEALLHVCMLLSFLGYNYYLHDVNDAAFTDSRYHPPPAPPPRPVASDGGRALPACVSAANDRVQPTGERAFAPPNVLGGLTLLFLLRQFRYEVPPPTHHPPPCRPPLTTDCLLPALRAASGWLAGRLVVRWMLRW